MWWASGEGVRRFIGRNVKGQDTGVFGPAIPPCRCPDHPCRPGCFDGPITAGGVVLAYNLPGFEGDLKRLGQAYAGIFLGEITHWDDS